MVWEPATLVSEPEEPEEPGEASGESSLSLSPGLVESEVGGLASAELESCIVSSQEKSGPASS